MSDEQRDQHLKIHELFIMVNCPLLAMSQRQSFILAMCVGLSIGITAIMVGLVTGTALQ